MTRIQVSHLYFIALTIFLSHRQNTLDESHDFCFPVWDPTYALIDWCVFPNVVCTSATQFTPPSFLASSFESSSACFVAVPLS